jgi:23S rRNA pseudouridine2605 synthase
MAEERLQKILAQAGIASRRAAEQYVTDGRVRVNGKIVRELGAKADPKKDKIEVQGHGALAPEPLVFIALHKPLHVVSTVRDPEGRTTVLQVLQKSRAVGARRFEGDLPRVYPVGRLDFDAEGLLLLTNDGDLAHLLTHPRSHVPKTYMVKVRGIPEDKDLERLRRGVRLKSLDGRATRATAPADVQVVKKGASNSWLEVTVFEGRYHQVKRMCEAIGHFAIRLVRTDFGGIALDDLPPGAWRLLTSAEVDRLRRWQRGPKSP